MWWLCCLLAWPQQYLVLCEGGVAEVAQFHDPVAQFHDLTALVELHLLVNPFVSILRNCCLGL